MNADYTKVSISELPDFAAGRGDGSMEARGVRDAIGAQATGAMFHRLKPDTRQPFGHVHNEAEELFLVLSGSGRVNLGEEIVELGTHDVIRIAPSTPRCFESGSDGMELFAFGPHIKGDGRLLNGWWGGDVPPAE